MYVNNDNYVVEIEDFARRHYIKLFNKKYKKAWDITEQAILRELERVDRLLGFTDKAEKISVANGCCLIKLNFKIADTNISAKSSGNRAIVLVDHTSFVCKILLVYSKNEISPPNETQKWMNNIKLNYPAIWKMFYNKCQED
ncbi:MAG: hypothetical protein Q7S37_01035 [bacterium]|nr:hypothetical protein [bacterium]